MELSVSTPSHLNKIELLPDEKYQANNEQQERNFLFKTALSKIAFLPFGYLIDKYRWKIFDGSIPMDKLNTAWWDLRYQYQGVVPPKARSNVDFDAGAKYHIPSNYPYIRYFISFVVQFQFHKALCQAANHKGPLHKCDIYQSKDAGEKLLKMLQLGSSQPWPVAMKQLTGTSTVDAGALMEYFQPLMKYLKDKNRANGECFGWGYTWPAYIGLAEPRCPAILDPSWSTGN